MELGLVNCDPGVRERVPVRIMAALDTGADLDLLLSGEDFMRLGPEPRVLSAAKRVGRPCSVRTVSGEEIPIQYFELEVIVEASHNMTAPFRAKLIAARLDGVGLDGPSLVGAPLVRRLVAVGYSVDAAMGGSDGNLEDGGTSRGLRARVVHGGEREDDEKMHFNMSLARGKHNMLAHPRMVIALGGGPPTGTHSFA